MRHPTAPPRSCRSSSPPSTPRRCPTHCAATSVRGKAAHRRLTRVPVGGRLPQTMAFRVERSKSSPAAGLLQARVRAVGVAALPGLALSPVVLRRRARPRRVLPLRLARPPVFLARLHRQPRDVSLCVVPAHAHHRMPSALVEARIAPAIPFVRSTSRTRSPPKYRCVHEPAELRHRHLVPVNREQCRDCHFMHRGVPLISALLERR